MASSPPKRRKTSPTTSIPVDATPQRKEPSVVDALHTAPDRASFLSPTKASLARFNPGLLERPKSAVRERQLDTPTSEIPAAANGVGKETANGHGEASSAVGMTRGVVEKQNGENSPPPSTTIGSPGRKTRSMSKQGPRASPRRRSQASLGLSPLPEETVEPLATASGSVAQTVGENGEAQSPSEGDSGSQVMKALQALAQLDGANDESEAQEPIKRLQALVQANETNDGREAKDPERALKALAQVDGTTGEQEVEELELPPTPSQRGLADPIVRRPPIGLLNTPSKRPRKNRALGETLASSPIKPRSARRAVASPTKDRGLRPAVRNPRPGTAGTKRRRQESPKSAERDDASSPKRRKRDDLRTQLRKLQDEVAMHEKQVELAREVQTEGGHPTVDPTNEEDRRKIISLLLESNDRSFRPPETPKPLSLSLLDSLLPFSKALPDPSATPSPPPPQGPIPSHRPIDLANPLPYLSLFTPLTFTSTTTSIQPSTESAAETSASPPPTQHHHLIKAHSPQHLLNAAISLTVDTSSLHISSLQITALSPWAESELGTWLHERASERGVEGRDISGCCWAMGSYWEMASRRAKCWWRCEKRFGGLLSGGDWASKGGSSSKGADPHQHNNKKGANGKQRHTTARDNGNDNDNDDTHEPQPTRRDLTRHLGQPSLHFQRDNVELLIKWAISLDWTGEAESSVSATARAPSTWKQADERNSLSSIPDAFDALVRERGVLAAVTTVVALLFP